MISIRERLEARSNDSLDKEATEYIKRLEDALKGIARDGYDDPAQVARDALANK